MLFRSQDFSFEGARTIQVYVYMYTSIRRSSAGKLCVGSVLAMCVLDHLWETMSWITPGKLCVVCFGPQLLGPEPWFPVLGRHGPWSIGPVCVASPLGHYVLHQSLETMCWVGPVKLCVVGFGPGLLGPQLWLPALVRCFGAQFWADMAHGPLGRYVLHPFWDTMCCISRWKLCVASSLGNYV